MEIALDKGGEQSPCASLGGLSPFLKGPSSWRAYREPRSCRSLLSDQGDGSIAFASTSRSSSIKQWTEIKQSQQPPNVLPKDWKTPYVEIHISGSASVASGMRNPEMSPADASPPPDLKRYYRDEGERRRLVGRLFQTSAHHYDRIAMATSFGSNNWYRREALKRSNLGSGMKVLDVACGTGDFSRAFAPYLSFRAVPRFRLLSVRLSALIPLR